MQKNEFSKYNTLALKGIAIIMMIFHHCFRSEDLFKNYQISFFPISKNFAIQLSNSFKICVSIFVFITGYGLMLSLVKLNKKYEWTKKDITKWLINRLIKMLSGFWIIAIISYIVCQLINGMTGKVFFEKGILSGVVQIVINFFGLSNIFKLNEFNSTWWYMSIAILYVLTIPILAKLLKKYSSIWVLAWIVFIPRILNLEYKASSYISFLFALVLGMIFAKNNLLVKIANFKLLKGKYINKVLKFIIETLIIFASYIAYNRLSGSLFYEIRYGIIPVLLICYFYEFYIEIPIVKQLLSILGKYSMDIFLIHTFFRTYYLNEFIYSFGNWIKIALVLLIISFVASMVIEEIKKIVRYDKLINKLQKYTDGIIENNIKD